MEVAWAVRQSTAHPVKFDVQTNHFLVYVYAPNISRAGLKSLLVDLNCNLAKHLPPPAP